MLNPSNTPPLKGSSREVMAQHWLVGWRGKKKSVSWFGKGWY